MCPYCTPFIVKKSQELAECFNTTSLLKKNKSSIEEYTPDTNDGDAEGDEVSYSNNRLPEYSYQSHKWESHITDMLSTITIPQPQLHVNHLQQDGNLPQLSTHVTLTPSSHSQSLKSILIKV